VNNEELDAQDLQGKNIKTLPYGEAENPHYAYVSLNFTLFLGVGARSHVGVGVLGRGRLRHEVPG
jgi:hypothetical protein